MHKNSAYVRHLQMAAKYTLDVVLPILDVVPPQDFDLTEVIFFLPCQKVNFLQQFLLVVLELPHF